ncbi:MAG: mechanosensitive ion channel family protein [Actinomycetes bacterium]
MFVPGLLTSSGADRVSEWLNEKPLGRVIAVALIIIAALVARWLWIRFVRRTTDALTVSRLSNKLATTAAGADTASIERYRARANAVSGLLVSVGTFVIVSITIIVLLARVGVDVAPLIASAGVIGIAIGFGAQTIVRDFLSGVFMIMENQYGIGDTITVSGITGTVEDVGLRITQLRDVEGTLWYVTNGSVTELGNRSQGWSLATVDIPVAYGADLDQVQQVLTDTAVSLQNDESWKSKILADEVQVAAESMTPLAVTYRIRLHTAAGVQLTVGRELRVRALSALEAAGIAAPTPTPAATGDQP